MNRRAHKRFCHFSTLLLGALLIACGRHPEQAPARPRIVDTPTNPLSRPSVVLADAGRPSLAARSDEGRCSPPPAPAVASDWRLVGYNPGPVLREVISAGPHHATLIATTSREVCVSHDWGVTWTSKLGEHNPLASPAVTELAVTHTVVAVAQGSDAEPRRPEVFVSRDGGGAWEPLPLPAAAGEHARVFTDRKRVVWVADGTKLWWADDARSWQGPRTLPGTQAEKIDACGSVLIGRIHLANDWYFHRSEDGGATWRPMRLGHLGIDAGDGTVRCLGWNDLIEAGHGALPTHWSADGGRTWERARYDDKARAAARTLAEDPGYASDPPHCASTWAGELACMDAHRLVFPERGRVVEVTAPAACERVRMIDDHRMIAFGVSCGVFLSQDRGGLWRRMSTSVDPERARRVGAVGRGGFLGPNTVWRIDDGLWWSDDLGARWRLTLTQQTRALAWGVFSDRRHGVFARDDGWVATTRDGGETWIWALHEEVERLARAGSWLMLTTSARVRVSPDGGETWRNSLPFPPELRPDPTMEVAGDHRWIDMAPGVRVSQRGDRVEVIAPGEGGTRAREIARGLPRGWEMLAAHATNGTVDRVLLAGGAVLRHEIARDALPRFEVSATRAR